MSYEVPLMPRAGLPSGKGVGTDSILLGFTLYPGLGLLSLEDVLLMGHVTAVAAPLMPGLFTII